MADSNWIAHWYTTFGRRLQQADVADFRSVLGTIDKVSKKEVCEAIDSMVTENFGFENGHKTPSIQALKWHVLNNRKNDGPTEHQKMIAEANRIKAILLKEPDKEKRWDIMCEETAESITGMQVCQILRPICTRPKALGEALENIKQICDDEIGNHDLDRPKGMNNQQWGAHKLLTKGTK